LDEQLSSKNLARTEANATHGPAAKRELVQHIQSWRTSLRVYYCLDGANVVQNASEWSENTAVAGPSPLQKLLRCSVIWVSLWSSGVDLRKAFEFSLDW
jgi:hypothetical protein